MVDELSLMLLRGGHRLRGLHLLLHLMMQHLCVYERGGRVDVLGLTLPLLQVPLQLRRGGVQRRRLGRGCPRLPLLLR